MSKRRIFISSTNRGLKSFRLLMDEKTRFDEDAPEPESPELRQLQRVFRAEIIRDKDWRSFANTAELRAELVELRFPWEGPAPDHKPCNLPLASIGTLFKGRDTFLDDLRERLDSPGGHCEPASGSRPRRGGQDASGR